MIEKAGHGGGKAERSWGKYLWAGGRRGQTVGRWAGNLPGAAGTVRVTQSERQNELLACYVVRSETRGNEDLGAKSQILVKEIRITSGVPNLVSCPAEAAWARFWATALWWIWGTMQLN
jgi:hypothetical protein